MSDQSTVDNTGNYYSINVPAPSMQTYLRLGAPDSSAESNLSTTPAAGNVTSANGFDSGMLLYTQGEYQLATPVSTTWSGDSLSAVLDGNTLVGASYTAANMRVTYNYSNVRALFNTTVGSVSNVTIGNQLAYWLGNSASTGVGGLLWSNYGLTQNVFAGQIVNVINQNIDVQGLGEAKVQKDYEVLTTTGIDLLVAPAAGITVATAIGPITAILAGLGAVGAAISASLSAAKTGLSGDLTTDPTTLRDNLQTSTQELAALTGIVVALQAVVSIGGIIASSAAKGAKATAVSQISLSAAGVMLTAGTNRMLISPTGLFTKVNAQSEEQLTLNVGSAEVVFVPM